MILPTLFDAGVSLYAYGLGAFGEKKGRIISFDTADVEIDEEEFETEVNLDNLGIHREEQPYVLEAVDNAFILEYEIVLMVFLRTLTKTPQRSASIATLVCKNCRNVSQPNFQVLSC